MSLLSYLADRLILMPSTQSIDPDGKRQIEVKTSAGHVEIWEANFPEDADSNSKPLKILKFPGTAGRAERSGVHPAEVLTGFRSKIWTVNPHGYGGSSGPATTKTFPDMCESVYKRLINESGGSTPILVIGNSLGCLSALYLASRFPISGLMLRNPPPIHQLISTRPRYAGWNFGMSKWIANEVPSVLDAVANSASATAPCLFVQSEKDRIVPTKYQDLIIDAYAGTKQVFVIPGAGHHEFVQEAEQGEYLESLRWFESIFSV